MTPQRIQRSRKKGSKLPENTVCVTRPSRWGNPFVVGKFGTAQECVDEYVKQFLAPHENPIINEIIERNRRTVVEQLKGKNIACWCKIGDPCHGDVLLEIANQTIQ